MIAEPQPDGHRMHYVRYVAAELLARGATVQLLTTRKALSHPAYKLLASETAGDVETIIMETGWEDRVLGQDDLPRRQLRFFVQFKRYFGTAPRKQRPAVLFVPTLDHCDKLIGAFGSPFGTIPFTGLALALKFHFRAMGVIKPFRADDPVEEFLYWKMLRRDSLRRFFTIDKSLVEYVGQRQPELAHKVDYVPDPVEIRAEMSRADARALLRLSPRSCVVLVYGEIEKRKGIECLLRATDDPNFPVDAVIVLAGPQTEEVRALVGGERACRLRLDGRLVEVDRFLVGRDEDVVFGAADIVWLGYENFYWMSAVMIQAGRAGLPVIASPSGLVGRLNREHLLGLEVVPSDRSAVAGAVRRLAADTLLAAELGENGRRLARSHDAKAFAVSICNGLIPEEPLGATEA